MTGLLSNHRVLWVLIAVLAASNAYAAYHIASSTGNSVGVETFTVPAELNFIIGGALETVAGTVTRSEEGAIVVATEKGERRITTDARTQVVTEGVFKDQEVFQQENAAYNEKIRELLVDPVGNRPALDRILAPSVFKEVLLSAFALEPGEQVVVYVLDEVAQLVQRVDPRFLVQ